jgi:iron complex transport system substrate-binding protein
MGIDRRALIGGLSATLALVAPRRGAAASIVDATGRTVTAPRQVTRVFAAGPPAAIVLYTLAPELLLGWPRANPPEARQFLLPGVGARPELGRLTGRGNTANLETVMALKPDLILDIGYANATYASLAERVEQQTGIPYVLLDGHFEAIASTYRALGRLLGRPDAAEKLARYADSTMTAIATRVAKIPEQERPRVYYARGPQGLLTGLGGSINVETIAFVGARNVAAGRKGGLATVSMEQVLLWNPDIIVTIDKTFAARVRNDPSWAAVAAVRSGRVHLSPLLPFPWIDFPPSVNRLIGLWWLAKIFYPGLFAENLHTLTHEFYDMFYHVPLDDARIDLLLAPRD